jgi:hypothetical protein
MITMRGMIRALAFSITVAMFCGTAAAEQPLVTFVSPCDVRDNNGECARTGNTRLA